VQAQLDILSQLDATHMFQQVLAASQIGVTVSALRKKRKRSNEGGDTDMGDEVYTKASELLKKWKRDFNEEKEREHKLALAGPMFTHKSKVRNKICKAFYGRLALTPKVQTKEEGEGATPVPVERDLAAITIVKNMEQSLYERHESSTGHAYTGEVSVLACDLICSRCRN
jgi:hypothetical protein